MVVFPTLYHPGPSPRAIHNNLHTINAWPLFPEIPTGKNPRSLPGCLQSNAASGPNLLPPSLTNWKTADLEPLPSMSLDSQK